MNRDKGQQQPSQSGSEQSNDSQREDNHPSPFNETALGNENCESNTHDEANLEQERKESTTERD